MKKTAFVLCVIYLLSGFVFFPRAIQNRKEKVSAEQINLKLGDYIVLGNLEQEPKPILWRYVSQDENGILMLSDCSDGVMLFGEQGNNCWSDSYVRKWLNSSASTVDEVWGCRFMREYASKGFLHSDNFTDSQKSVIKPVMQRNLLAPGFPDKAPCGGSYDAWNQFSAGVIDPEKNGYYDIAYEMLTDKVFILDIKQLWEVYQNREVLGDYYEAGTNIRPVSKYFKCTTDWSRTPFGIPHNVAEFFYEATESVIMSLQGDSDYEMHFFSFKTNFHPLGVRPAFYLNEDTMIILSGDGSKENPYVVDGNGEPDVTVVVNEEILTFDQPPIIQNDRTLVPLRGIFEAMGAQVDWEEETKTITAQKDETVVTLQVDSDKMYVNGQLVTLDVPAIVINDRTLVPLRAISEAFGATVEWEQPFRLATIKN